MNRKSTPRGSEVRVRRAAAATNVTTRIVFLGAPRREADTNPRAEEAFERRAAPASAPSLREVQEQAAALLLQVLDLLNEPICKEHAPEAVPFELARRRALKMLDRLSRMGRFRAS